jgi:DNA-binding protein HU-beta
MHKSELCKKISGRTGLNQQQVRRVLEEFMGVVTNTCMNDEGKVTLHGFGTFHQGKRSGRSYRHPVTKETRISVPSRFLAFKPSKNLDQSLDHREDV